MRPSKFEWAVAVVLFLFLFVSWDFGDTTTIVGHVVDFADAIVHGEFGNFYQRAYDRAIEAQEHHVHNGRGRPAYDPIVNFVLGVWGLPLYFVGGLDYAGNFWKILYGKSFFFLAFVISAVLVYKIGRALGLSSHKSQWTAFIYFTSTMAWNSICLVGNIDAICTALTLAGVLAYIRGQNGKCFVWFMLAFPFKQLAAFIYLPLLLLRDKNLFRDAAKLLCIALLNAATNITILSCPGAAAFKNKFMFGMLGRLVKNKIPLMSSEVSIFVILYGLFCVYCWFRPEPDDEHERNTSIIFTAMTSIAITLGCIQGAHPQWWLYLALCIMYYARNTERLLLFETVGTLGLLGFNYLFYWWVYVPSNAKGMLLDILTGGRETIPYDTVKAVFVSEESVEVEKTAIQQAINGLKSSGGAVFVLCMIVIIFMLCWTKDADLDRDLNVRPYALSRLFVNACACYLPLAVFLRTIF